MPLYIDGDDRQKFSTCMSRCVGILMLISFVAYVGYQVTLFGGIHSFNMQTVPFVKMNETK